MRDLVIRPAVQDDLEVLWDFLAMAAYEPDAEAAKAVPRVAKYLVGWQRPGDFGFIAEQNGEIIGAAWAPRLSAEELKFPYGDEETPKVSIGVKPNARGQGVGLRAPRLSRHPRFRCHEPRWRHVDRHGTRRSDRWPVSRGVPSPSRVLEPQNQPDLGRLRKAPLTAPERARLAKSW